MNRRWLLLFALLWFAPDAMAADCTDGTDCFCDCVTDPSQSPVACESKYGITAPITSVLLCEDFEAITLYDARGTGTDNCPNVDGGEVGDGCSGPGSGDTACVEGNENANCYGNTGGLWGPWYDNGSATFRGEDSYWYRTYPGALSACSFQANHPDQPALGVECGSTCGAAEYRADNAWGGNDRACIDIVRNGEFNDEDTDVTAPALVADGKQSLGNRVQAGDGIGTESVSTAGFHGTHSFGHNVTEMGWTQWLAYPDTISSSLILTSQWKHNEGGPTNNGWPIGNYQSGRCTQDMETFPFNAFMWSPNPVATNALEATATAVVGEIQSNGSLGAYMCPLEAQYKQSRDFPFGQWGCIQSHVTGLGTANARHRSWFNGTLIVDIQNINAAAYWTDQYWGGFSFNNFSNYNQFVGQATTRPVSRYDDNLIIREGEPVSCATIGYSAAPPPTWGPGGPGDGTKLEQPSMGALAKLAEAERKIRKMLTLSLAR